jgi:hypothetical protein
MFCCNTYPMDAFGYQSRNQQTRPQCADGTVLVVDKYRPLVLAFLQHHGINFFPNGTTYVVL